MKQTYDHHHGIQKVCSCGRKRWGDCAHSWYLRWTPPRQKRVQIKIDDYAGKHIALKKEAATLAIEIKVKLKAGTFPETAPVPVAVDAPLTTRRLGELYFEDARNKRTGKSLKPRERERWQQLIETTIERTNGAITTIGDIPAASITSKDVEAFKVVHAKLHEVTVIDKRGKTYQAVRGGTVSANRIVGRWRAVCGWAVTLGHLEQTPFVKGGVPTVGKYGEQGRDRRLIEGELEVLLSVSSQNIQDLIEVAINTGCRKGELLSLRWYQVRFTIDEIMLDGKQTKNGKARSIPMLTRTREILERRHLDPDGEPYSPMAFVFGNVAGEKLSDIKTAWTTARLKAAGFTGVIRDPKKRRLTPEARAALQAYDLRFHDLRREAGSSFIDDGMDPRAVQTLLGHANLATTNKYLRLEQKALHAEAKRLDERRRLVRIGIEQAKLVGATGTPANRGGRKLKAV